MGTTSKDLLQLEHKKPSISPLESTLLVCKNESLPSQTKKAQPDKKPITAPLSKSQLFGKVRNFLGVMSEANEKLQLDAKDNPEKYDIEVLTGDESQVINMECMLGMVDLLAPEAVAAAEAAVSGYHKPVAESSSGEESDISTEDSSSDEEEESSDDNEDDESDEEDKKTSSPVKPKASKPDKNNSFSEEVSDKRPKKRPKIVELS